MAASSEPLGTYLMPIYACVAWIGIFTVKTNPSFTVVLPVSIFGALWALRNTLVGPNVDLGVFTMGALAVTLGVVAFFMQADIQGNTVRYVLTLESVLIALNFLAPLFFWKTIEKALAKSKSMFWFKVFKVYLLVMAVYWFYVAYKFYVNTMQQQAKAPPKD